MALRRGMPAAVGAGRDPGIRPLFEGLFAALCPKGGTRIPRPAGVCLTTPLPRRQFRASVTHFARKCEEVKGVVQRYVYVELTLGADLEPAAEKAIRCSSTKRRWSCRSTAWPLWKRRAMDWSSSDGAMRAARIISCFSWRAGSTASPSRARPGGHTLFRATSEGGGGYLLT